MTAKKKKDRIVYSTDPDFLFDSLEKEETATLTPSAQNLYVSRDKKQRKGKQVTLVEGFFGTESDLKELGKLLKSKCGTGGTVKQGQILIQGDFRDKVKAVLESLGYSCKLKGG